MAQGDIFEMICNCLPCWDIPEREGGKSIENRINRIFRIVFHCISKFILPILPILFDGAGSYDDL